MHGGEKGTSFLDKCKNKTQLDTYVDVFMDTSWTYPVLQVGAPITKALR